MPVVLVQFNESLILSDFQKTIKISDFMKIHPVGSEMLQLSYFSQFCECA